MVDKGLLSFIKRKFETHASKEEIRGSLRKAGFSDKDIDQGFKESSKIYKDTHQDVVAANNFLPPLSKKTKVKEKDTPKKGVVHSSHHVSHGGVFFQGRLHRVDFILGSLFFVGLGIVFFTSVMVFLSSLAPGVYEALLQSTLLSDSHGWIITIPIIFLPITFILISLCARRLHDIGLPGSLSLILIAYFIPIDTELFSAVEILGLYIVATGLVIIMLAKRGFSDQNKYGHQPVLHGSFFNRIINLEH